MAKSDRSCRNNLPYEPPYDLLLSMAIRYDHGLGCDGYYDSLYGQGEHERRLKCTISTMRQLYEEVSGHGFYRWPDEQE